jgi:hypothetical protein
MYLRRCYLRKDGKRHAAERDTEANRKRREEFVTRIATIAPNRLVFLDESGVTTAMTRLFARSEGGGRSYEATPGDIFRAYVEPVLCAALKPGDVVVMDNLSSHKVSGVQQAIEKAGASVVYGNF